MKPGIKKRMLVYPLIYILFGVFLFLRQRSMIYFPVPHESHPHAEEIISNEGESIRIIVLNPGRPDAIVYFGGNAETVLYNAYEFRQNFPDHTVYLFNYRGYGGSSGRPTEKGIFSDALALYDTVKPRHRSVSAIGRSLGSGVAVYLAAQREIDRLALITPFDSIARVAQRQFPIYPVALMLLDRYDSHRRVREIKAQCLVLTAGSDRVIKPRHARRLAAAFPQDQVTAVTIEEADHNDIQNYAEYHRLLKEFFAL
jgi:uncharacterized protein